MIIWRGWGIVATIIPFLMLVLTQLGVDALFGADTYQRNSSWLVLFVMLAASAVLWPLGRYLNRTRTILLDEKTGERFVVRSNHGLFFINMEYWALILPVIWAALTFA